jgi:DNA-3-methyladenine glycosylase
LGAPVERLAAPTRGSWHMGRPFKTMLEGGKATVGKPLPRSFYARPVLTVARDVIGKILVHETAEGRAAGRIVEAEAYRGPEDRAAHSFGGRRTARTEAMFGPPGFAYVFFVYGMHWHVNLVTTRDGEPHAVLIRALEPLAGIELMAARRGLGVSDRNLTNGPGKVCQALDIDKRAYGLDLCGSQLFLCDGPRGRVARSARVGVDYAGAWAERPWRFFELGNAYVSRPPKRRAKTKLRS